MATAKKIIAFVGMPGSGKGSCSDYLHEQKGHPLFHFGNMVYEEVQRRGLDNVEDEIFVREDMRQQEGAAVMAKHIARKIDESEADVVLLDGLYSWSEYVYLSETYGDIFFTIALVAPKKLRRQRVIERQDGHRKYTLDKLIKREVAEIENIEKGGPIAYADYYLLNTGGYDDLYRQLNVIYKEIIAS